MPRREPTPIPPGFDINLPGNFNTRMAGGARRLFDGIINGDPVFDQILDLTTPDSDNVHRVVKGLFKKFPRLIFASPQQVMVELAIQFGGGLRRYAALAGTTVAGVRALLQHLIQNMPLYNFSNALSRLKQHDRDLANDDDTGPVIREWRDNHRPTGSKTAALRTLVSSLWVNESNLAVDHVGRANSLKARHRRALADAPVLSICMKDKKGECVELDKRMIEAFFPDVK